MIVGIDLGTSTSEVSFLRNGKPHLIREVNGSERGILPSVVGLNSKGTLRVGQDAVALLAKPGFAVQEAKRQMGKPVRLPLGGEEYTPQEISAFILRHLKDETERYLGEPITDAVITVPAYFTDAQRQATEDAGELAGLRVRRLINEPTAAALAYGLERPGAEEKILVYDLGGGTLDVTVLELSEGYLDVFASTGNNQLGGKDFDERLMDFLAAECRRATGVDLLGPKYRHRLKPVAKRAKEALSSADTTTVFLDNLGLTADQEPIDFELELTRAAFERIIRPLVESTREQLDEALAAKGLTPSDIQTILMIGGSTRVPLVQQFVSQYFGGRTLRSEVSPDEAVSLGAAVLAGIVDQKIDPATVVITDVCPFTLGVSVQRLVGDERISGFFDPLIEKQSTIPRTARKVYRTSSDWQDAVHVEVFQGEAEMCADNEPIADFMHPIKPAPAGQEVEIEFSYDLNNLVEIVVRDPSTGKETRRELRAGPGRMSDSDKKLARTRVDERWRQGAGGVRPTPAAGMPSSAPHASTAKPQSSPDEGAWKKSPLYANVAALMTHAERRVPELAPDVRGQVIRLLADMRAALVSENSMVLETTEQALTDLLFDLG
jgi:molecular chaperone DnaK